MANPVLIMVLVLCGSIFTGLGIFAMKRSEPMWFYSGTEVKKEEIENIPAYNRANGMMWIVFSLVFWIALIASLFSSKAAGVILFAGTALSLILLPASYHFIYERYRTKQNRSCEEEKRDI